MFFDSEINTKYIKYIIIYIQILRQESPLELICSPLSRCKKILKIIDNYDSYYGDSLILSYLDKDNDEKIHSIDIKHIYDKYGLFLY